MRVSRVAPGCGSRSALAVKDPPTVAKLVAPNLVEENEYRETKSSLDGFGMIFASGCGQMRCFWSFTADCGSFVRN